jgi:hypothetical protein
MESYLRAPANTAFQSTFCQARRQLSSLATSRWGRDGGAGVVGGGARGEQRGVGRGAAGRQAV